MRESTELLDNCAERLALTRQWLSDYPVNPHPDLGRTGPVCPYMGRAWDLRRVELFPVDVSSGDDCLIKQAYHYRDELEQRSRVDETDRTYLVYFLVPYGLSEETIKPMVQRVHSLLRAEFVSRGLLAGDFWPDHETPGLHSTTFRPFECPLSTFAIRNMIPSDLEFFAAPSTPPEERLLYLELYRQHFEGNLPTYWAGRLSKAVREAREAIANRRSSTTSLATV